MGNCGQVQSPNDVIQDIGKTMNPHPYPHQSDETNNGFHNAKKHPPPPPSSKPRRTSTALLLSPLFLQLLRYTIASCQPNSSKATPLMIICRLHKTKTFQATYTPLKPLFFHLDSSERGVKQLCRAISKRCSFGVRIPWFRVDRRPIRVKVNAVSKKSRFVFLWPQC